MPTPPALDAVRAEFDDGVATITLNRPDALNAWNGPLNRDLHHVLEWARDEDQVRAIVITGAGRAFCAGADLSAGGETFTNSGDRGDEDDTEARTPSLFPWDIPKPVIAAINGHAVGVGATYALACDMRFMADDAKIGFVFARRGMLPELGSHAILPRVVGLSNASDLLLGGRAINGTEAASIGLVTASMPRDRVLAAAVERAREMATMSAPMSMAISKRLLWQSMGVEAMRAHEEPLFDWVAEQSDSVEGVASFLDKRDPEWSLSVSADFPNHLFADQAVAADPEAGAT
ncbi:MAG: enoyl-CoA hydratase-related protein [Actinomycetota bacterium]